jgi:hypothetical protein
VERLRLREADLDWKPAVEAPPLAYERKLRTVAAPSLALPVHGLDEARALIRQSILEYLEDPCPGEALLIKTLPGTGKTTLAVEAVDVLARKGKRIGYAGPRHDLYADVIAKSDYPGSWYEWLPRQSEDPEKHKPQTCNYTEQINTWMQRGFKGIDFCEGVCGWDYINDRCPYHRQKGRTEQVLYIQHQHVTLGHPATFDVLFGDESPIPAFLFEWVIPAQWIIPPEMDYQDPFSEVLANLMSVAQVTTRPVQGPELLDLLGGAQDVLDAAMGVNIPEGDIQSMCKIRNPDEAAKKPYFHIFETAVMLRREAEAAVSGQKYPYRVIVSPGKMTLLMRREVSGSIPNHVIWLDATGRAEIYETLFQRPVRVVDASPHIHGNIYQVVDRANGKHAILGENKSRTLKAHQAEDLVRRIVEKYEYLRPVVISFKDFVENTDLTIDRAHFYAARGTNAYEDADAVMVLGAPQPDIFSVVKMAKMIWWERMTPFDVTWCTQDVVYQFADEDGLGRSYPVSGFHHDRNLQTLVEVMREDEIIQAAHRGRPVNHPVDIWLLTNIPIRALPPDKLLTMRDVMDAPMGVDVFKWGLVQKLMADCETIKISDLVELGINRETATKYLEIISKFPGWEVSVSKTSGRGRPSREVSKCRD